MLPEGIQASCASAWLDKLFDDLSDDSTASTALSTLHVFFPAIITQALDLCDTGKVERLLARKCGLHIDVVKGHYTAHGFVDYHTREGVCTCRDFAVNALPDPLAPPLCTDEDGNLLGPHRFAFGSGRGGGPMCDDGPVSSGGLMPMCAHVLAVRIADATGRLPVLQMEDQRVIELLQQAGM